MHLAEITLQTESLNTTLTLLNFEDLIMLSCQEAEELKSHLLYNRIVVNWLSDTSCCHNFVTQNGRQFEGSRTT